MNRGYVKLWRKTIDSGLLQNAAALQVFTYCLLKASHKHTKMLVGTTPVTVEPGQVVTGRLAIAKECKLSERNVRTALKLLENLEIVTIKPTNKFSVVSFVNWDTYQQEGPAERPAECPASDQQVTSTRPASDHKQEFKNLNNNIFMLGDKKSTEQEVHAVATLPLSNGEDYPITQEQIAEWSKVFTAVDIPYQIGRMKVWCEANPKKKKTRRGILKFITNWLGNKQDKGGDRTQTLMDAEPVWVDPHKEHHEILNEIADKYGAWGPDYYHGETDAEYEIREEKMIAEAVKRGVPEDYARGDSHD